jgi:hypothetical protein
VIATYIQVFEDRAAETKKAEAKAKVKASMNGKEVAPDSVFD